MTSTAVPLMLLTPVVNSWLVMEVGGFYWKWVGFTGNRWCVLEMSGVWWRRVVCGGNGPKWGVGGLNGHCQQVAN